MATVRIMPTNRRSDGRGRRRVLRSRHRQSIRPVERTPNRLPQKRAAQRTQSDRDKLSPS
jgi:hypothetical protein